MLLASCAAFLLFLVSSIDLASCQMDRRPISGPVRDPNPDPLLPGFSTGLLLGCTADCRPLTDSRRACPRGQFCTGSFVRHWTHLARGCAITACAAGTLQYGDQDYSDTLFCRSGEWFSEGRSFGESTTATCGQFTEGGCTSCRSAPERSTRCPRGKRCDASLLERATHRDTGCLLYRCKGGAQLLALVNRDWYYPEYVDCHLNQFWRLGSLYTLPNGAPVELTCEAASRDTPIIV